MPEYDPHEHEERLFEATVEWERQTPRPLFILNGGAAITALTYIGNAQCPPGMDLRIAMLSWIVGLIFAAVVVALGYRSQSAFLSAHRRQHRPETATPGARTAEQWGMRGDVARALGYTSWIASLAAFAWGAWIATGALMAASTACG
jgi:hypothetical protein